MASIKVKLRASTDVHKEGTLYYQVIHERVVRQIKTDYHICSINWNQKSEKIIDSAGTEIRREELRLIRDKINWDVRKLKILVASLDSKDETYTADDVVALFREASEEKNTVFEYIHKKILYLKRLGKIRTSETHQSTLNSFMRFRENQDLSFDHMDAELMELYEAYLKNRKIKRNSSSFYMRILHTVYNQAVEEGLTTQKEPFKRVYTGIDKTVKRAISMKELKRIKELDLSGNKKLDYARDMFLMSFYMRGMSFIDMAYLRKKDLASGIITYCRRKTGQQLIIQWEKHMQTTLAKYEIPSTQYLLPIIEREDGTERRQYQNKMLMINRKLKEIGEMANISIPLSLYCARHSWASIARGKNIPLSVISEGMGHDSEVTTQIYLASIKTSVVDQANSKILKDL